MSSFEEQLTAIRDRAAELSKAAQERELTEQEYDEIDTLETKQDEVLEQRRKENEKHAILERFGKLTDGGAGNMQQADGTGAKSLGEHFVKSNAYGQLVEAKGGRFSVSAPEYSPDGAKAAGDPMLSEGLGTTQYGQVVQTALNRPVVASLFASGALSATSLTYWVQDPVEGDFATVPEGGAKPGMTWAFHPVTEGLHKIAGWYKISDESAEDAPYVVSVINNQLLVRLALAEEQQLLNGDGSGANMTGILQASGIQTMSSDGQDMETLFSAVTAIQNVAQLTADGIIVNPSDYQKLRLEQDANNQYYGGGPFTGAYGVSNGVVQQPPIWGYPTVVTPALAQGTALVGAFQVGGQVFRKGGVRVDSTNSDGDDFQHNIVAVRAEERLLMATYQPQAFVKVTLGGSSNGGEQTE